MLSELEETKALLIQAREAAKGMADQDIAKLQSELNETKAENKGTELNSKIQEFPVVDNDTIKKLTAENDHLKVCMRNYISCL